LVRGIREPVVLAVALAAWWGVAALVIGPQPLAGDDPKYLAIATGARVDAPWSFHILTPRLAALLSTQAPGRGFIVINALSFVGCGLALAILLATVGSSFSVEERWVGVALFGVTCTGAFMYQNHYYVDPLSYFLLTAACAATLARRDLLLGAVTVLGIFNRETALFVTGVWLVFNWGVPLASLVRRAVLIFGPAVVAYLLLHHTSVFLGYRSDHLNYVSPAVVRTIWNANVSWLGASSVAAGLTICVLLAYGPAWVLALVGLVQVVDGSALPNRRQLLALLALALPVAASLAVVDWRRGFQPLMPAVVVLALLGLRRAVDRGLAWRIMAVGTVVACWLLANAWMWTPMRIPAGGAVLVCCLSWAAALFLHRRRHASLRPASPSRFRPEPR
jgi:hypothetical protein